MENESLNRYMQFVDNLNENITSTIQLMNNLRYNVFEIHENHLRQHSNSNRLTLPLNLPLNRISTGRGRTRRPRRNYTSGSLRSPLVTRRTFSANTSSNTATPFSTIFSSLNRPTELQINNATTTSIYRDISTNFTTCPISRTQFTENDRIMQIQHCGHVFTENSLREWFRTSSECPMCRHNIGTTSSTTDNITPLFTQAINTLGTFVRDASTNTIVQDFSGTIFSDTSGNEPLRIEYTFQWPT